VGVLVSGLGLQGILLEHREIEFGDKVNIQDVFRAVGENATGTCGILYSVATIRLIVLALNNPTRIHIDAVQTLLEV